MFTRKSSMAACVLAVTAVLAAACGSAPGAEGGSAGSASAEAKAAAKALGIDLTKCGIDPTAKLGETVKIGQTYAMSGGPATAFAPVGQGVKAAVQNFSATSGLASKFELIQADDQFMPDKALTATQQLIDEDGVAAMTTTIGTPSVLAIRPLLESSCVPLIGGATGGASANKPGEFPWTVAFTMPSAVDARIWVQNIAEKYPNGTKIAMFYANDASGKDYLAAVKHYLAETKSKLVSTRTIENTDSAAPSSQVTTMRSSGADVLLAAPTGAQCVSLMKEVAAQGWKPRFYMSSTCSTSLFDLAGPAADGVLLTEYVKDPTRAPYNNDPAVKAAEAVLKKYAPKVPLSNSSVAGIMYPAPLFEAIKRAEKSGLGLTRLGLLQAATHMSFQPDLLIPGIKYQTDYPKDVVAMEAGQLSEFKASDKTFTKVKLYDFEGQMTGVASS